MSNRKSPEKRHGNPISFRPTAKQIDFIAAVCGALAERGIDANASDIARCCVEAHVEVSPHDVAATFVQYGML